MMQPITGPLEPYHEGYNAFIRSLSGQELRNPYPAGPAREDWQQGWWAAATEYNSK